MLIESQTKDKTKLFGRSEYMNSVIVESENDISGQIKNVKISKVNRNTLFGEIISSLNQTNYAA